MEQYMYMLLVVVTAAITVSHDVKQCVTYVSNSTGNATTAPDCCCSNDTLIRCVTLTDAIECVNDSNIVIYISEDNSSLQSLGSNTGGIIQDVTNISIIGPPGNAGLSQAINCNCSWIKVENVTNFTMDNVKFLNCGRDSIPSFHFNNCHGITLTKFELWNSTALSMTSNNGAITIQNSSIINCINKGQGGGMAIYLNGPYLFNITLTIRNTFILHNKLPIHQDTQPTEGGGIYLSLNSITNVIVNMTNVIFASNSATLGGGMLIIFNENATNNTIILSKVEYELNEHNSSTISQRSRGGGLRVVYNTHPSAGGNSLMINHSRFEGNVATVGSGLSLVSNYVTHKHLQNTMTISHTSINGNVGSIGMALHAEAINDDFVNGGYLTLLVIDNYKVRSNSNSLSTQNKVRGMGVVYTEKVPMILKGYNNFESNRGTALVVSSTYVYFMNNSDTKFTSNTGTHGGAMALVNNGRMIVGADVKIQFNNNTAYLKGAAIYSASYGEANLPTYHKNSCFVRLTGTNKASTTNISFINNTIVGNIQPHSGHQHSAIYLPSLQPCMKPHPGNVSIFSGKEWFFSGSDSSISVTTAASHLSTPGQNRTVTVVPGQQTQLPLNVTNDEGDDVTLSTPLLAYFPNNNAVLSTESQYVSNGSVIAYKIPGITSTSLTVQTLDTKYIFESINVTFAPCPPAFQEVQMDNGGITCKCFESFDNNIKCDGNNAKIYDSYCIGYDTSNNKTTYSYLYIVCPYMGFSATIYRYYQLPSSVSQLFSTLCSLTNRGGQFCSKCANSSLGVSVTSINRRCVPCPHDAVKLNWLLYGLVAFIPTTLLFLIITICSINLTSGSINTYIFYCQSIMLPENLIQFQSHFYINSGLRSHYYALLFLPMSIWGLEYVEAIVPPLCLHPALKTIHVYALEYVAALYPLCLILATYCLIELHDRGCRLVVTIWKPFKKCLRRWHKTWNTKRSIIDVFAAFLLLSYTKFTNVTISLLVPNPVYNSSGHITGYRTLADSSVRYNSPEHRPFIFMASVVLVFIVILPPLFLFLYPFRVCERLFGRRRRWRPWLGVMAFVDTFNGSFKDGTNGTYDYRWFASFYFIMRILAIITQAFSWNIPIQRLVQLIVSTTAASIIALVQPHKNTVYNRLDVAILLVLSTVIGYAGFYSMTDSHNNDNPALEISYAFFIFLPPICLAAYVMWVLGKKAIFMVRKCGIDKENDPLLQQCESLGFPDRLLNPEEYFN